MKLQTLDKTGLEWMIQAFIANYHEHNTSIPEELGVMFDVNLISESMAKITFSWNNGKTYKEEETNFAEDKRDDDYFTILAGEPVIKLQEYVGELLDRLTA